MVEKEAPTSSAGWIRRLRQALARADAQLSISIKLAALLVAAGIASIAIVTWTVYQAEADRIRSDFEERALLVTRSVEVSVADHGQTQLNDALIGDLQTHIDGLTRTESSRVDAVAGPDARDEMARLSWRFNAMAEAIQTFHGHLQNLATTDPLTGLWNRRYAIEALEREIQQARRRGEPLAAIILDLDGFKQVNDRYGHAVGDEVLRRAADVLRRAVRNTDIATRFGGDEFVVVLPNCDADALRRVLERIQRQIGELGTTRVGDGDAVAFSLSAGAALLADGDNADLLLQRADLALYEAKRAGRDQVRMAA